MSSEHRIPIKARPSYRALCSSSPAVAGSIVCVNRDTYYQLRIVHTIRYNNSFLYRPHPSTKYTYFRRRVCRGHFGIGTFSRCSLNDVSVFMASTSLNKWFTSSGVMRGNRNANFRKPQRLNAGFKKNESSLYCAFPLFARKIFIRDRKLVDWTRARILFDDVFFSFPEKERDTK